MGLDRHISLTEKLQVRRTDAGFQATIVPKPIDIQTTLAHGMIDSSLFEAANQAGLSDPTVLKLAKIFGSDIDFVLGLRAGDEFVVNYERIHQNGQYVKDGEILAARFINQGRIYEAVRYVGTGRAWRVTTHPTGRSMEKAFLRAPLEFRRVSSGFSLARLHPILNTHPRAPGRRLCGADRHTGLCRRRGPTSAFAADSGGYGNVIEIDHGSGIVTVYGHLSRFANARAGRSGASSGETIGYVGMTGLATGPHLHYEFRVNGRLRSTRRRSSCPMRAPIDADAARRISSSRSARRCSRQREVR